MSIVLRFERTLKSESNQDLFGCLQSDSTEWLNVSKAIGKSCLLPINAETEASFPLLIHAPHCRMMHTEKIHLSETLIPVIHYGSEGGKASFPSTLCEHGMPPFEECPVASKENSGSSVGTCLTFI